MDAAIFSAGKAKNVDIAYAMARLKSLFKFL